MANRATTGANETQLISTWKQTAATRGNLKTLTKGRVMRLNRAAAGIATVAIASAAIVSGCGVTHQGAVPVTRPAQHLASAHPVSTHRASAQLTAAQRPAPADPSLAWLESAGGQAQVTFNNEVDTLAADLQAEDHAPTVAGLRGRRPRRAGRSRPDPPHPGPAAGQ
jgi:hypothetical protein